MERMGSAVTVSIPQGALRGRRLKTPSGRTYCSFQGIPYAKPPVGPLRFKLPTGENAQLIPVMVWIHGGAFLLGSGNTELYGPDYLMEHDVLLVTFNYRLGVLGFLSTEDQLVPGNAGLKDMVMALKWVKSNIARFGGDPGNVTIFGESAGSMSCHILSISSAAKGLFQRVICQSGVPIKGLMGSGGREQAFGLARALGFTGNTTEELVAFLMEQPARRLVEHAPEAVTKEVKTYNQQINILNVDKAALRELNLNFQRALPATIPVKKEERIAVARDVKRFYFDNQPLDESTIDLYADLHADLVTIYPSVVTARILSSMPAAQPTYFYHFDVTTKLNVFKKLYGEQFSGVSHCDDLPFLFSEEKTKDIPKGPETEEGKAIARVTRLWTNFAKTGNPTPDPADPMLSVTWLPFKKDEGYYLDITNDGLSSKKDLMKDRVDFWDRIFRM
ncbi:juvenile hormone esterase-like [Schistocerca serialis cubense]|uniref:juvenile hormone esterase-like n=1 Tax=Schistocerca serialis cubense TaxID=2023355 RepID=UPI00214F4D41|nr:juvenile hormone esterase-like [Schistocerca serialis cubense]